MAEAQLTFHTTSPLPVKHSYQQPPYAEIVGLEHGDGVLWLPGHEARSRKTATTLRVSESLISNLSRYVEFFHINHPDMRRDCHIGAAAITGDLLRVDPPDSLASGKEIIDNGEPVQGPLPMGVRGVLGTPAAGEMPTMAWHSVVGLGEDQELCLQVDSTMGPLSLCSYTNNLRYYQEEQDSNIQLYAQLPLRAVGP